MATDAPQPPSRQRDTRRRRRAADVRRRRAQLSPRSPTRSAHIVLEPADAARLVDRASRSASLLLMVFRSPSPTCSSTGVGIWGINIPVGLGLRHHQFRLVDRHRPRRHADLGHSAAAAPEVADVDQPLRRGHDASSPSCAPACSRCLHLGRPWFFYWLLPYPNTMGLWPQFRSAAGLGRVRGQHLLHGVAAVLVHGHDPRPGDAARPRARAASARSPTASWRWAGATRPGTGSATRSAYLLLAGLATPLVVSVHSVVSSDFAMSHRAGLARDGLPALLRRRGHLLRLRHGAGAGDPAAACLRPAGLHHASTISNVMGKILLATSLLTSYGYFSEQFMAWYGGEDAEALHLPQPPDRLRPVRRRSPGSSFFCNIDRAAGALVPAAAPQPAGAVHRVAAGAGRACGWSAT